MKNQLFVANALKTFSSRSAQLGLRRSASALRKTHMFHASVGVLDEMVELFDLLHPYLSGSAQWNSDLLPKVRDELGDVGYYAMILSKTLRVKAPDSKKKVKLKGFTRTEAMYRLLILAGGILSQFKKKVFYGPVMTAGTEVKSTVNKEASAQSDALREAKAAELLKEFLRLYWAVVYDITGDTPDVIFNATIAKLAVRYPDGTFDLGAVNSKDTEKEAEVFK